MALQYVLIMMKALESLKLFKISKNFINFSKMKILPISKSVEKRMWRELGTEKNLILSLISLPLFIVICSCVSVAL